MNTKTIEPGTLPAAPTVKTSNPRTRKQEMNTYSVTTDRIGGGPQHGVTVSLSKGSGVGELLRHFPSDSVSAARAYEARLHRVAEILNETCAAEALAAAADALDMAQAQVDSDRDRKVLLAAMYAAREAAKSL
jgi:hypothetical protein